MRENSISKTVGEWRLYSIARLEVAAAKSAAEELAGIARFA
jgi:hypothetical protein